MSLYDDLEDKKSENVSGWASGIKFLQNHMQPKKVASAQAKANQAKKQSAQLAPVIDLNKSSKYTKDELYDSSTPPLTSSFSTPFSVRSTTTVVKESRRKKHNKSLSTYLSVDSQWQFDNEYDPLYPNDYEKALRDLRERRDKEAEEEEIKRRTEDIRDDEENFVPSSTKPPGGGGAAIAPPASLSQSYDLDKSDTGPGSMSLSSGGGGNFGLGVGSGANAAARIMAKYGYKEGQGLGKKEQGMATALMVEKITHRTGRIIHEKDEQRSSIPEPTVGTVALPGSYGTPPIVPLALAQYNDDEETMEPEDEPEPEDPTRNPSKVVLLKNMVSPQEVDDDLEPEVKDECNTKYGPVINVTVFQMPDMDGDDAIRIFVEFERVDSAMKALIDLNGRFFGGRQVKALFYDYEKYTNLELTD